MAQHLKQKQYYIDLYDKHTVEMCRYFESNKVSPDVPKGKKVDVKQLQAITDWAEDLMLTFKKGERWENKNKTINEWMEKDRQRDELLESTNPPEDIRCLTCRNQLKVDSKQLLHGDDKKPDRILFIFECPNKCLPRRTFFNDGEEWRSKQHVCAQCRGVTKHKVTDDNVKMVTTYTCVSCKYVEVDEYEWSKKEDEYDEHFAADRDRFCLSDEEGRKFQDMKWSMERMAKFGEEWEEKEKARAKKLEENPKGFLLDGAGYTCAICKESTPQGDNWYDKWGVKCLVCQWAIDKGEVPASLAKNKDSWYSRHDFEYYFNVKGPTLNKWTRTGIVTPRIVSKYGEGTHTQVFLIKDNKDFLPPKKLLESKRGKLAGQNESRSRLYPWYCFGDPHEILKGYKIMDYLRVVPPEEMAKREEEQKLKWEKRQALRNAKMKRKNEKQSHKRKNHKTLE